MTRINKIQEAKGQIPDARKQRQQLQVPGVAELLKQAQTAAQKADARKQRQKLNTDVEGVSTMMNDFESKFKQAQQNRQAAADKKKQDQFVAAKNQQQAIRLKQDVRKQRQKLNTDVEGVSTMMNDFESKFKQAQQNRQAAADKKKLDQFVAAKNQQQAIRLKQDVRKQRQQLQVPGVAEMLKQAQTAAQKVDARKKRQQLQVPGVAELLKQAQTAAQKADARKQRQQLQVPGVEGISTMMNDFESKFKQAQENRQAAADKKKLDQFVAAKNQQQAIRLKQDARKQRQKLNTDVEGVSTMMNDFESKFKQAQQNRQAAADKKKLDQFVAAKNQQQAIRLKQDARKQRQQIKMIPFGDEIVRAFFKFQHELKLYHWQTKSYSRHKATDKLYEKLLESVDEFIEVYMGKYNKRVCLDQEPITVRIFTQKNATNLLVEFSNFLTSIDYLLPKHKTGVTDLLNIRDELLGYVDQTIYLFSLK
jgi:hypothetical protein